MTPAIRPATLGDVPALVELEELLFGVDAWNAGQLSDELTGPGRRGWVAAGAEPGADDGAPAPDHEGVPPNKYVRAYLLGYTLTMTVGDIADLQRIGVLPDRQRSGIARALLETATAAARGDGADRILLEVSATNTAALAFYAANGFEEIDRRPRYYKDGADAIVMRRQLGAE
jgi:ribosomal-protein-alanine N-acetyltransferase